jgi:hypothetical protein
MESYWESTVHLFIYLHFICETTEHISSLNVFDDGAELLVYVFWTSSIVTVFFSKPLRFEGWLFRPQVKPAIPQNVVVLKKMMMDKVQKIYTSTEHILMELFIERFMLKVGSLQFIVASTLYEALI